MSLTGNPLNALPPADIKRRGASRKAEVVRAIYGGLPTRSKLVRDTGSAMKELK